MVERNWRTVKPGQLWLSEGGNEVLVLSVAGELVTVEVRKLGRDNPTGLTVGQRITWHATSLSQVITA